MEKNRDQIIVKTSIIEIVSNVLFVKIKAFVDLLSSSIAIVLDAVNNLSDVLLLYWKFEWMIISIIVLYAGLSAFIESFKSIFNPQTPDYSTVTLIFVGVAVIVKIVLGKFVKTKWNSVSS